ncbi:hypothetical protein Sjap_015645 [Stephania japonica]|uniref:Uncharacterized protein n=1 Tax=Stephania japonica TaxID=461633 RepID=A0AAP0IJP1_9MAGN
MSCVRVIADFYTLRKEVEIVMQRVEEIRASAGVQQLEEELSVLEKNAADRTILGSSRRRFVFYIENVVVVIVLALKFGHGVVLKKGYAVTLVIAICTFVAAYGWSWGPLGWLVPSELFPLEMRSAAKSVVVCVNLSFTRSLAAQLLPHFTLSSEIWHFHPVWWIDPHHGHLHFLPPARNKASSNRRGISFVSEASNLGKSSRYNR